MLHLLGADRMN